MKISLGGNAEIVCEANGKAKFYLHGEMIFGEIQFHIRYSNENSKQYFLEVKGNSKSDIPWEFAKEAYRNGFHVKYLQDNNQVEFYYGKSGERKIEYKNAVNFKTPGKRKCKHCKKMILENQPWCIRKHK